MHNNLNHIILFLILNGCFVFYVLIKEKNVKISILMYKNLSYHLQISDTTLR